MIGSVLYVVSAWTPDVGLYQAPANSTPAQASAALAGLGIRLLPRIRVDRAAAQPLVERDATATCSRPMPRPACS
jgi:DNA-binding transcriptional LysR family regulator